MNSCCEQLLFFKDTFADIIEEEEAFQTYIEWKEITILGFLDFWISGLGFGNSELVNPCHEQLIILNGFFSDIIEEEEAFQAYAEQRRYASTLGRTCMGSGSSGNGNNTGAQHCRREGTDGEKIRNLKGNISRLVSDY